MVILILVILQTVTFIPHRLSLAEYHEQEEIFKLRIGHLKKVQLLLTTYCYLFLFNKV